MAHKDYVCVCIIADRDRRDGLEKELYESGGALISHVYGHGYHESHNVWEFLGFREHKGKVVLSCLLARDKAAELIEKLNTEYSFNKPGTGIAFTVPVEHIVF